MGRTTADPYASLRSRSILSPNDESNESQEGSMPALFDELTPAAEMTPTSSIGNLANELQQLDDLMHNMADTPQKGSERGEEDDGFSSEMETLARSEALLRQELEVFTTEYFYFNEDEAQDQFEEISVPNVLSDSTPVISNVKHASSVQPVTQNRSSTGEEEEDDDDDNDDDSKISVPGSHLLTTLPLGRTTTKGDEQPSPLSSLTPDMTLLPVRTTSEGLSPVEDVRYYSSYNSKRASSTRPREIKTSNHSHVDPTSTSSTAEAPPRQEVQPINFPSYHYNGESRSSSDSSQNDNNSYSPLLPLATVPYSQEDGTPLYQPYVSPMDQQTSAHKQEEYHRGATSPTANTSEAPLTSNNWLQSFAPYLYSNDVHVVDVPLDNASTTETTKSRLPTYSRRRFLPWLLICLFVLLPVVIPVGVIVSSNNRESASLIVPPETRSPSSDSPSSYYPTPVAAPSLSPISATQSPTLSSTILYRNEPSLSPSILGTVASSSEQQPATRKPTNVPTVGETPQPSGHPKTTPTALRTSRPSFNPTSLPTFVRTSQPSVHPTNMPSVIRSPQPSFLAVKRSMEPTVVKQGLFNYLVSISLDGGAALKNNSSPQYAAYDWLANNANLDSYDEQRLRQRYALAVYYYSTNGSQWTRSDRWLSDAHECDWYSKASSGVCGPLRNYERLEIYYNNASGTIPPELAILSNSLDALNLQGGPQKFLTGTIPPELGQLTKIKEFRIPDNHLEGSIPSQGVDQWIRLEWFDVSNNMLNGNIPREIAVWSNVAIIDVSTNRLQGPLPTEIQVLTKLALLQMANNRLTGALAIGTLKNLRYFDVHNNLFTSLPTTVGQLMNVNYVLLSDNMMRGTLATEIGLLGNLIELDVGRNDFSGTLSTYLGRLTALRETLDLSSNRFTGTIPTELGLIDGRLRILNLNNNDLVGSIPSSFQNFTRLNSLRLDKNSLNGSVPVEVCAVFNQSVPIFYADCSEFEFDCPCCTHCCVDSGGCTCRYMGTDESWKCL